MPWPLIAYVGIGLGLWAWTSMGDEDEDEDQAGEDIPKRQKKTVLPKHGDPAEDGKEGRFIDLGDDKYLVACRTSPGAQLTWFEVKLLNPCCEEVDGQKLVLANGDKVVCEFDDFTNRWLWREQ